jgi:hypothetical protein
MPSKRPRTSAAIFLHCLSLERIMRTHNRLSALGAMLRAIVSQDFAQQFFVGQGASRAREAERGDWRVPYYTGGANCFIDRVSQRRQHIAVKPNWALASGH